MIKSNVSKMQMDVDIMELKQLGASIDRINSETCYIEIKLDKTIVSYIYNVNLKHEYFLKRVLPYPLTIDKFDSQADVFEVIKRDIKQFKNAQNSRNISEFIEINTQQNLNIRLLEDLFLYYNVNKEDLDSLFNIVNRTKKLILNISSKSKNIYKESKPFMLKKFQK